MESTKIEVRLAVKTFARDLTTLVENYSEVEEKNCGKDFRISP